MEPIEIYPALYVLKLVDDCWYVGMSYNLNNRLSQHMFGRGAKFTKLHRPICVDKVIYPAIGFNIENEVTLEYMEKYGKDKVRGGKFCRLIIK